MLHAEVAEVQVVQRADILTAALNLANKQLILGDSAGGSNVLEITSESYQREVLESKLPVVLDAYMDGCHPCHDMEPIFDELSNEMNGRVKFVKLNGVTESIGRELKIRGFPTFIFFKNGKIVERHVGSMDKNTFTMQINKTFF